MTFMHLPALLFAVIMTLRLNGAPVITEVCVDPPGGSTAVPGDASHEYVEIFNPGPETVDLCAYFLLSGSAASIAAPESAAIQVWHGDSLADVGRGTPLNYDSLLPTGRYAIILGRKYASAPESAWYRFPAGTHIFALHRTGFKSGGLSGTAAQVSLMKGAGEEAISTFNAFRGTAMASGDTASWQRVHPDSSDAAANWTAASPTPGSARVPAVVGLSGPAALEFWAVNRRLVAGCDSLSFINLKIGAPDDRRITVRAYDLRGRPVRELCRDASPRAVRFLQWDGRTAGGAACPPGVYVLLCEARRSGGRERVKTAVVIGGRCGG